MCTVAWHWAGNESDVAATVLRAKINYNLLSKSSSGSFRPSNKVPNSQITLDIFWQCNCCSGEKTYSLHLLFCHLPRILSFPCFFEKYVWLNNLAFNFLLFYLYKNYVVIHIIFRYLNFLQLTLYFKDLNILPLWHSVNRWNSRCLLYIHFLLWRTSKLFSKSLH